MIELLGLFPVNDVMAARAIRTQLAFVDVFVAGDAILREPHERVGQICLFYQ